MTLKALLLSTVVLLATPAFAQTAAPAPAAPAAATTVSDPAEFATKAAIGNMFELKSSALAQDNTQNADVLAFAQQMTTDHSKAAQDMLTAATTEKVTPPSELDEPHQTQLDALENADGDAFDAAYIDAQVKAHDEAVALFEGYASGGPDGALKDFATKTLPTLKMHQDHIHALAGK
jgi:putative membrane protein